MSPLQSSNDSGAAAEIQLGDTIFGRTCGYYIQEFIGEGSFGKVARCRNVKTGETVAVKIVKDNTDKYLHKEVSMLELIGALDPDKTNLVKFFEQFQHRGQTCLVFEMLDMSLFDTICKAREPWALNAIRPVAKQLLVALDALESGHILHADLKPDNIMLVNVEEQPFRVKLIDFGLSTTTAEVWPGMIIQPLGYRAPEIGLGLPFDQAIDVWGVGCILAFLYLANNLFPIHCQYQMMKSIVELLGQPDDHMLDRAKYTKYLFTKEKAAHGSTWRFMTPEEYTAASRQPTEKRKSFSDRLTSLDDLVHIYPMWELYEHVDCLNFVDLLKELLHLDGDQRISAHQALQHPFITMEHLTTDPAYFATSQLYMTEPWKTEAEESLRSNRCTNVVSSDGVKDSVLDIPDTRSSDGVQDFVIDIPDTWSSDAVQDPIFDVPEVRSTDGVLDFIIDIPDTRSSDAVQDFVIDIPDTRSSDGVQDFVIDIPDTWSSDAVQDSIFDVANTRSSDGVQDFVIDIPDTWSSDGGQHQCTIDTGLTRDASASSGCSEKRFSRFLSWIKSLFSFS